MTTDPTPPAPIVPPAAPVPPAAAAPAPTIPNDGTFRDDELVYVDPDARQVVGRVQWSRNGNPKSMPYQEKQEKVEPSAPAVKGKPPREERRRSTRKYYPWGTYKAMKNIYKLEGKKKFEPNKTLEEILPKALVQPFWD